MGRRVYAWVLIGVGANGMVSQQVPLDHLLKERNLSKLKG